MEFYAASEGYFERQKEKAEIIRFAAYRIAESMAGTKALGSIEKFWPMGNEEEQKKPVQFTKEQYDAIMRRHKIKQKV